MCNKALEMLYNIRKELMEIISVHFLHIPVHILCRCRIYTSLQKIVCAILKQNKGYTEYIVQIYVT